MKQLKYSIMKAFYTLLIILIPFVGFGQNFDFDEVEYHLKNWPDNKFILKFKENKKAELSASGGVTFIMNWKLKNDHIEVKDKDIAITIPIDLNYLKNSKGKLRYLSNNSEQEIIVTLNQDQLNLNQNIYPLVRDFVESRVNSWLIKSEFEKISTYENRVKKENLQKKIDSLQNDAISYYSEIFEKSIDKNKFILANYDAENETFLVKSNEIGDFILEVPINEAKNFKESYNPEDFGNIKFKLSKFSDNDYRLVISEITYTKFFVNQWFIYVYNSSETKNHSDINLDYRFIDYEKNINDYFSNIKSEKYNNIISQIEYDIPINKKINKRYAIIIGNENYSSYQKTLDREQDVPYAVNDAYIFKEYALKTLGVEEDNLFYLENATSGQMNQTIDLVTKIVSKSGDKAELIFYYAGHGFPDELTKEPYLIPVDVSTSYLNNAISLDDLYDKFSKTGTKRVLAFVDACFSGGARENSLLVSRGVKINPKMTNISNNLVVFSASSETQSALPYDEQGHGMFTFYLLNKLKESSGKISLGELYDYISEEVSLNSLKINQTEQEPNVLFSPTIENKWQNWQLY